jgi:hypothetical protein
VLGTTMVAVIPGVMTGVGAHALLGNIHARVLPLLCAGSISPGRVCLFSVSIHLNVLNNSYYRVCL